VKGLNVHSFNYDALRALKLLKQWTVAASQMKHASAVSQITPKMGSTFSYDSFLVSIFSGPLLLPTLQHAFEWIPEDSE